MMIDAPSFDLPATIAQARARRARHQRRGHKGERGAAKISHNYVAENLLSHGNKKENSKRAGAPSGNLNAVRFGKGNPELTVLLARARDVAKRIRATLAQMKRELRARAAAREEPS